MTRMFEPLDPRQITRIEAVHRGFLYQHLYGAACLLWTGGNAIRAITIERDEDIELELASGDRVYVQVKTRTAPLQLSDISGTLARFELIRAEHLQGRRSGRASLVIIANVAPGPELLERVEKGEWPPDVRLVWPGVANADGLPPAWADVDEAVRWCTDRARALPMSMLEPDTLVWKLAGKVQLAAMGGTADHAFATEELPALFEQLAIQLQQFPSPPNPYRPQRDEPDFDRPERVRIVCGFSGAGKTAWAAQAAMHGASMCAYYDVGDVPGLAIAASLVRELAGQWVNPEPSSLRRVLLPGATGIEALRALDKYLATHGKPAIVVLDNAHRVSASDLRTLIEATHHLRFVLLAQQGAVVSEVETLLHVEQEVLRGWSLDEVASEVAAQGAQATPIDLERLRALTGGLPLYVRTAAKLSVDQYGGDVARMCAAVEAQTHLVASAQELILSRLFDGLPETVRDCAAVLSLSDVPLSETEAARLIKATLGIDASGFAAAIRQLRALGVIRLFGSQRLQVHDAVRVLGQKHFASLPPKRADAGRVALKDLILESFTKERDASRFPLFIRTLVELGELKILIDLATEEWFHELGITAGIWEALDAASVNEAIDPEQRFYALDGLVFADMKAAKVSKVPQRLEAMERLLVEHDLGAHERLVFHLKKMVFDADRGREDLFMQGLDQAKELVPDKPAHLRIFRYNAAMALVLLKRFAQAEHIATELVEEYYAVLGLARSDVVMRSNKQIAAKLPRSAWLGDDLKHLADTLDLLAKAVNGQGRDSGLARIHAAKFYGLANAIESFVKVNQDLVDEFIGRSDYVGARQVMEEHLLPAVIENKVLDKMVGVRSQYAVVLGYCGEYDAADQELARLEPYRPGLSATQRAEIDNQRRLLDELRRQKVRPGMVNRTPAYLRPSSKPPRVGRNEPCPCGSGQKYKRCHGR